MQTKWRSEWLDWQPSQEGFVGFEGSIYGESSIIQLLEGLVAGSESPSKGQIIGNAAQTAPTKPTEPIPPMPYGVELLKWNPKRPPVAITQCAVVTDVESFVGATTQQVGRLLLRRQPDYRRLRDLVDARTVRRGG